jgi:pSer/pThr/pTyr-binding forkhead associated (FHA) protein
VVSEEAPFPRLIDLAELYGRDPHAFDRDWAVPVLVRRRDATPQVIQQPGSFHTQAQDSAAIDAALRQTRDQAMSAADAKSSGTARVPMPDDVIRLEKRQGGAFAERIGIGRAPNVDVQLLLSKVSKYHAYVTIPEGGAVQLADAKSTFGTFVEGQELEPMTPIALGDGVAVRLATYEFRFHTSAGLRAVVERQYRIAMRS